MRSAAVAGRREVDGGGEEQSTGDRGGEVQDAVGVAGRITEEHVVQHLFGHRRRARVADEVGAEFALAEFAERHVVSHDLELSAVVVGDDVERDMCVRRLVIVAELDVFNLVRPITRSCSGTGRESHAVMSCRYFCTCT